ncbi:hypothetical protein ACLOJK_012356 [Asimina triloba]
MAGNPLQETRPIFVAVYAAVLAGIVFSSAVYIFSPARATRPPVYSVSIAIIITVRAATAMVITNCRGRKTWPPLCADGHISSADVTSGPSDAGIGVPAPPSWSHNISTRPIWDVPPTGSKMPPMMDFRLTKAMVDHWAKDNVIIVTFGNYAFMDFIVNWVKHLTDLGVFNLLVGAMDTKLLEALYWKGVPVFDMGSNMDTIDVGWGSQTFHKMGREKVILIDAILPFGYELLMCDTDMVWLKNPLPYFARFPEADILTSTDQVIPTVTDDRLDTWQQGTEGKRHRLREGMVFYDEPEYYDSPGNLAIIGVK